MHSCCFIRLNKQRTARDGREKLLQSKMDSSELQQVDVIGFLPVRTEALNSQAIHVRSLALERCIRDQNLNRTILIERGPSYQVVLLGSTRGEIEEQNRTIAASSPNYLKIDSTDPLGTAEEDGCGVLHEAQGKCTKPSSPREMK